MENFDLDIEQNDFDNFLFRRRRPRRRKREMRMPNEEREIRVSKIEDMSNGRDSARKKKRNKHKAVLKTLKTQGFFANPTNHRKIYNQVKKMAIEIDDLSKKLIKEKAKPNCECGSGKRKIEYRNFKGKGFKNTFNKIKTPLLLGGAIYFFFFSKLGKKIIKK